MAVAAIIAVSVAGMASNSRAQEAPDTLAKIARTKTVVVGHRQSEAPFSYVVDGQPSGYSIDLCKHIIEHIQKKLKLNKIDIQYVPATAATRFVLMRTGKIDMECAATTNNAERRKMVGFSFPHFFTATRFVSKKSSGLDTIADLAGRSVVATTGTINIEQLNAINRSRSLNISVLMSKEHKDAFAMVENGRASAFVMDDILLAGMVAASVDKEEYAISSEALSQPEPYGLLLPLGDTAFRTTVNEALHLLSTTGEFDAIYAKWFMSPVAPSGMNLNLPMSPELKAEFAAPRHVND